MKKEKEPKKFILKVYRGLPHEQYWEEFELVVKPFMNVITALMEVQKKPVNRDGKKVTPIAWEQGCLEEVCGSCSMLVNGKPRQACTALIDDYLKKSNTISLAPFSKFPLKRDLVVDREKMFKGLKKVKAWATVDDAIPRSEGAKVKQDLQEEMYTMSTCMTCGCCTEACPQFNVKSKFIGAAAISQARLFNKNPAGKIGAKERNHALMEEGGIADCGNAQNCVQVCPKGIPLTESIAEMGRETTKEAFRSIFD